MLLGTYATLMVAAVSFSLVNLIAPAIALGVLGLLVAYRWEVAAAAKRVPRVRRVPPRPAQVR